MDFETVYTTHWRLVLSYFRRSIYNHQLAEDLTAETFIHVWHDLANYDEQDKLKAWVFRIAHNVRIDYIRRQRLQVASLSDLIANFLPCEKAQSEFSVLEDTEVVTQIISLLTTEPQRMCVRLALAGYNDEEILKIMKLQNGGVRQLKHRAYLALRDKLKDDDRPHSQPGDRSRLAHDLRERGLAWTQIGTQMGIRPSAAFRLAHKFRPTG